MTGATGTDSLTAAVDYDDGKRRRRRRRGSWGPSLLLGSAAAAAPRRRQRPRPSMSVSMSSPAAANSCSSSSTYYSAALAIFSMAFWIAATTHCCPRRGSRSDSRTATGGILHRLPITAAYSVVLVESLTVAPLTRRQPTGLHPNDGRNTLEKGPSNCHHRTASSLWSASRSPWREEDPVRRSRETSTLFSRRRRRGQSSDRSPWELSMAAPDTSAATSATERTSRPPPHHDDQGCDSDGDDSYEHMTVKELRELVKDRASAPKGLLSRLKKKQDLVQYLREFDNSSNGQSSRLSDTTEAAADEPQDAVHEEPSPTRPRAASTRRMPPLGGTTTISRSAPPSSSLSPKEVIFEQLYERYPRLLLQSPDVAAYPTLSRWTGSDNDMASDDDDDDDEAMEDDSTSEVDVRVDHPVLRAINVSSSDMDVVFVGTASCTPGITRGVSCTALRISGRRVTHPLGGVGAGNAGTKSSSSSKSASSTQHQQKYFQQQTFHGGTWLFDVGECTQLQIQRTSSIKPSRITKIFLTHAHGDHTFGLPGLLCLMGQDKDRSTSLGGDDSNANEGGGPSRVVDIYGPQGLRMWLRVAIRYSVSRIVPPYRVHELMDIPMAPEWDYNVRTRRFYYNPNNRGRTESSSSSWQSPRQLVGQRDAVSWISQASGMSLEPSPLYGEVEGGRDIYPIYNHKLSSDGGAPVYEVEDVGGEIKVYAAPMSHGIPCVGYVIEEAAQPGRLRHEYVEPIVKRNVDALKAAGFVAPMKAMAVLKNLEPGTAFTFPDGTVVTSEQAVEPSRPGRKVVICGDTCDSRALSKLAIGADVVVHEATNTYLSGVDKKQPLMQINGDSSSNSGSSSSSSFSQQLRSVTRDAVVHGHSTPFMAGTFAKAVGAHRLLLNHFSPRYKGDPSLDSLSIMLRIERQAMKASGMNETQVAAAWDLMVLPLPRR